ncbi:hypothetical protein PoB_005992900 [Plakobranchus ocellatus]|uniref:Uncharacterized protein n=1 Tax=Plakobranchus ocellatus TaxID=259542 RepID=A0AAV4CNI4_9GAST|nr:hypothetical protein PoB_005992900 [Plakobranchus ocellatus]
MNRGIRDSVVKPPDSDLVSNPLVERQYYYDLEYSDKRTLRFCVLCNTIPGSYVTPWFEAITGRQRRRGCKSLKSPCNAFVWLSDRKYSSLLRIGGVCGTVTCKSALRPAEILPSRV